MEEAFDPFGLEEAESEPQPAPDIVSPSPEHPRKNVDREQQLEEVDPFDPFRISGDPFAPAATVVEQQQQPTKPTKIVSDIVNNDAVDSGEESPPGPPIVNRIARSAAPPPARTAPALALPPKLNVKLSIHEEVSSTAVDCDGASHVSIEGDVRAQVQCSDALKNAPFVLTAGAPPLSSSQQSWKLTPVSDVAQPTKSSSTNENGNQSSDKCTVNIPKHEIGFVPTARFSLSGIVQHMPILLERKVMISGTSCRVAVQVRSKLSNVGNLHDFTIAVAIPEAVNGDSIQIVRGDGSYDELKRTIHWKLPELERGNSFMVSAQLNLWEEAREVSFPVMLRCTSQSDQIGEYQDFAVAAAEQHPSSVTYTTQHSFRLLHRLT